MAAFYTGKGDGGTTKLFDTPSGQRVSKTSPVFEALGMLDELNGLTGWCKAGCPEDFDVCGRQGRTILRDVQDHLFTIQAEVAGAPGKSVPQQSVERLGELIKQIETSLPPVTSAESLGCTNRGSEKCRRQAARTPIVSPRFFMRLPASPTTQPESKNRHRIIWMLSNILIFLDSEK